MAPHRILRQVIAIEGDDAGTVQALAARAADAAPALAAVLDRALDAADDGSRRCIDRLCVTLPPCRAATFEADLATGLAAALARALPDGLARAPAADPVDDALAILASFADAGQEPWWAACDAGAVARSAIVLTGAGGDAAISGFRLLLARPGAAVRIARALPAAVLAPLAARLSDLPADALAELVLRTVAAMPEAEPVAAARRAWAALLGLLVTASRPSIATLAADLSLRLSAGGQPVHEDVGTGGERSAPASDRSDAVPSSRSGGVRSSRGTGGRWSARLIPGDVRTTRRDPAVMAEPEEQPTAVPARTGQLRTNGAVSPARVGSERRAGERPQPVDGEAATSQGAVRTADIGLDRPLGPAQPCERDEPLDGRVPSRPGPIPHRGNAVSGDPAGAARLRLGRKESRVEPHVHAVAGRAWTVPPAPTGAVAAGPEAPPALPLIAPAPARGAAFRRDDDSLTVQGGIVLLWPLLPRLLVTADLVGDSGRFVSGRARHRAAALIDHLVTGDRDPPEVRLPLAKLLAGSAVDAVHDPGATISGPEAAAAAAMLDAALAELPMLGRLTVAGLRSAWLARPGLLGVEHGGWVLRVERRGWDVLLDRLAWSLAAVRSPWMAEPVRVEW